MTKYEYKFVRVELKSGWQTDMPKKDYHQSRRFMARRGGA
jgi:hypothetical protein